MQLIGIHFNQRYDISQPVRCDLIQAVRWLTVNIKLVLYLQHNILLGQETPTVLWQKKELV